VGIKNIGSSAKKHAKIDKVTASQDDDSVVGIKLVSCHADSISPTRPGLR
jgi:hypothetical protein